MKNKKRFSLFDPSFSKEGFTLIELLLTMAIIAILAGAILISLSSQRKRAQEARVLAEFSGVMQPMLMCRSDGGKASNPTAGNDICDLSSNYGQWPSVGSGDLNEFGGFVSGDDDGDGSKFSGNWYFYTKENAANVFVCCNSRSGRCKQVGAACDATTDLTN